MENAIKIEDKQEKIKKHYNKSITTKLKNPTQFIKHGSKISASDYAFIKIKISFQYSFHNEQNHPKQNLTILILIRI